MLLPRSSWTQLLIPLSPCKKTFLVRSIPWYATRLKLCHQLLYFNLHNKWSKTVANLQASSNRVGYRTSLWIDDAQPRPNQTKHSPRLFFRIEIISRWPQPHYPLIFKPPHRSYSKWRTIRYIFPNIEKECLPITKDIHEKITLDILILIEDLHIDIWFKVAWTGILCMEEFTYNNADVEALTFTDTKLTWSDITFSDQDQYRLKRRKTDVNYTWVEIILAVTLDHTCPVTALWILFIRDPQPRTALLFRLTGGSTAFAKKLVLEILQHCLRLHNIVMPKSYTVNSFCKGAAQYASENVTLDQHIQKLGRWTSRAF